MAGGQCLVNSGEGERMRKREDRKTRKREGRGSGGDCLDHGLRGLKDFTDWEGLWAAVTCSGRGNRAPTRIRTGQWDYWIDRIRGGGLGGGLRGKARGLPESRITRIKGFHGMGGMWVVREVDGKTGGLEGWKDGRGEDGKTRGREEEGEGIV